MEGEGVKKEGKGERGGEGEGGGKEAGVGGESNVKEVTTCVSEALS